MGLHGYLLETLITNQYKVQLGIIYYKAIIIFVPHITCSSNQSDWKLHVN